MNKAIKSNKSELIMFYLIRFRTKFLVRNEINIFCYYQDISLKNNYRYDNNIIFIQLHK